jgi:hypothetical protein
MNEITNPIIEFKVYTYKAFGKSFSQNQARDDEIARLR